MARSIPPNALAELAQKHGTEPILIVSVEWRGSAHAPSWYADRAVDSIPGKILEVGGLDNVVGISQNDTSQQIDIVLDDVDGTIKALFDTNDIHKRTARVYQYFHGLDLSDKFLIFSGKVSSPITWDERDRTVRFSVVSQIEDKEVGFSPEEGQFTWLPAAMVGKPWPLVFGKVLDVPALQMNEAVSGTTLCGVGVIAGLNYLSSMPLFSNGSNSDSSTFMSLGKISAQISTLWCARACYWGYDDGKAEELLDQINDLYEQRANIVARATSQAMCAQWQRSKQIADATSQGLGCNPLRILGGEDFPQGESLTLEINGALFTGYFSGQNFHIQSRSWPEGDTEADSQAADREETCPYAIPETPGDTSYDYRIQVPCGCGNQFFTDCLCRYHGFFILTGSGRASKISDDPIPQQFWAEPGATVRMYSDEPITYIVAHLYDQWPGTVLAVKAYKEFPGERRLVDVPSDYYTVQNVAYGNLKTTQIVTPRPLSSYKDQGWTDDLYVTFESNVGPDVTEILEYIIDNYTDLTIDSTSFAHVQSEYLNPFPMNFPILDRRNTVAVLQEIAYQARCALWISNGVVYLKYLPHEPVGDEIIDTITVSDIDAEQGIKVELTRTEDIVTKMRVNWRMRWSPGITDREKDKSEQLIILRHNVSRYGIQEENANFYAYNQPDIIYKCATFWLIRKSNTWKRISFSAYLHKLNLETFDCVTLDFTQGYVATGAVKAIVEEATYNSETNRIDFVCLVPVKAGEMEKYDWFWPAGLSITLTWPPPDEIASGDAGGDGQGADVSGSLPIGYFEDWGDDIVIVGGQNVVFRPQSDRGDRTPTDEGFTAQQVITTSSYGEVSGVSKPRLNLRTFMAEPTRPSDPSDLQKGMVIDIRKTHIIDSQEAPNVFARLSSLIYGINEDRQLTLKKTVKIADDEHPQGEIFDFKWADDYELWAAGTAFLRDD